MQTNPIAPFDEIQPSHGVCVADGWGIRIYVEQGHLIVDDGIGRVRRERRFHKATAGLVRLLIVGRSGYQTFEAARWLADAGISVIHLDTDSRVLSVSGSGPDKPALRRAQALASTSRTGVEIIRYLLALKLEGQASIAKQLGGPIDEIALTLEQLQEATDLDSLSIAEAQAAISYWQSWGGVEVRFTRSDRSRVPAHWVRFGHRRSLQSASGRRAVNPINAILNYLYALLEAEARIATIAVGLDPGLGILHLDKKARDSFALDLMEAARPEVDRYVLDLLNGHVFRAVDFQETRQGGCRIARTLTHRLGETAASWRDALAKPTEETAALLMGALNSRQGDYTTPLTQSNRRKAKGSEWLGPRKQHPKPLQNCARCGDSIADSGRLCLRCRTEFHESGEWRQAGRRRLAAMRNDGKDPAHGGEATAKRAKNISRQNLASSAWSKANPERPAPEIFTKHILPGLQSVTVRRMATATGLSVDYCSKIRRGMALPHPRHWGNLARLVLGQTDRPADEATDRYGAEIGDLDSRP